MGKPFCLIAVTSLALLGACASTGSTYTPFQPATPGKFGFTDQRIETNRFRVTFEGNSATTRQRVEDSLLLRAANLTLENSYDWFQIVNRATDPKTYQVSYPSLSSSWGGGYGYYGGFATVRTWSRRQGWVYYRQPVFASPFYSGFGDEVETRDVTRFQASAEIILGKGAKPANQADAFDARDVTANLTSRVMAPAVPAPK
jgi:hypothetical protein